MMLLTMSKTCSGTTARQLLLEPCLDIGDLRSNGESSQPLITPSSPQALHLQLIASGTSVRNTAMCPVQA
jgi:hypothetical protein